MWFFPSPLTPPQRPPRSPGAETPAPRDGAEGGGGHEASSGRGSERSGGLSPPPRCSGRPKDGGCSSCRPLNDMEVLDPPPLPQQRLGAGRCWSRAFLLPPPPRPYRCAGETAEGDARPVRFLSLSIRDPRGGDANPRYSPRFPSQCAGDPGERDAPSPRFSLLCVDPEGKGTCCPPFPQQRTGDLRRRGCRSPLHTHIHTHLFFCSALGTQEVASPTLPSFHVAVR